MNLIDEFKKNNIVKVGHWKLTKGDHSSLYVEKDRILTLPPIRSIIINRLCNFALMTLYYHSYFDFITGPANGALPWASFVAFYLNKPMVYPEKENNTMVFKRGFFNDIENRKILLIEDIITTGGSIQNTIDSIENCGGEVVKIIGIWNRGNWKHESIPNDFVVNHNITNYKPEDCPDCKIGIPLLDPKTNEKIEI